ncbi:hypothetical protein H5410_003635 [Solanum commersonii]|uniref:Uncharacterized protein n=1 Tax=Solanum commersonii TaxID=4109 RepID=A0A9J6B598_SOLCO|nr:hypothetical protein H5410_003635 [Solanum commersonii]
MDANIDNIGRNGDLSPTQIERLKGRNKRGSKQNQSSQIKSRIIDLNEIHHYSYIAILETFQSPLNWKIIGESWDYQILRRIARLRFGFCGRRKICTYSLCEMKCERKIRVMGGFGIRGKPECTLDGWEGGLQHNSGWH